MKNKYEVIDSLQVGDLVEIVRQETRELRYELQGTIENLFPTGLTLNNYKPFLPYAPEFEADDPIPLSHSEIVSIRVIRGDG